MPSSSLAPLDTATPPPPAQHVSSGRETNFWVFQVLFWLGIGLVVFDRVSARRPEAPPPWIPVAILVVSSFVISSLAHRLARLPSLQEWPRPQRWAFIGIVMLIATLGWALGSVWSKRPGGAHSPLVATAMQMLAGEIGRASCRERV